MKYTDNDINELIAFHEKQAAILELIKAAKNRAFDHHKTARMFKRHGLYSYKAYESKAETSERIYDRLMRWYENRNQTKNTEI